MARPRRQIRKSSIINIRVEPSEKLAIQHNAKQAGMHVSKFMLRRALGITIRPKYDDQMIHRLDRAAGLVKKVAIYDARKDERWMFWVVLKDMKKTVAAINAVVTRELELPKVIGTELRSLRKAAEAIGTTLAQAADADDAVRKALLAAAREHATAVRGSAEMISVAYQRELDRAVEGTQEDPILDRLLDCVVIAAGLKQDIFAAHQLGWSVTQIAHMLKTEKRIEVPEIAIELVINTANEVAQQC